MNPNGYLIKFRYRYSSTVYSYITFYYCFAFLYFFSFCFISFLVIRETIMEEPN